MQEAAMKTKLEARKARSEKAAARKREEEMAAAEAGAYPRSQRAGVEPPCARAAAAASVEEVKRGAARGAEAAALARVLGDTSVVPEGRAADAIRAVLTKVCSRVLVCACVRACACVCVHARVRACVCAC